jgi:hypothetical protein
VLDLLHQLEVNRHAKRRIGTKDDRHCTSLVVQ